MKKQVLPVAIEQMRRAENLNTPSSSIQNSYDASLNNLVTFIEKSSMKRFWNLVSFTVGKESQVLEVGFLPKMSKSDEKIDVKVLFGTPHSDQKSTFVNPRSEEEYARYGQNNKILYGVPLRTKSNRYLFSSLPDDIKRLIITKVRNLNLEGDCDEQNVSEFIITHYDQKYGVDAETGIAEGNNFKKKIEAYCNSLSALAKQHVLGVMECLVNSCDCEPLITHRHEEEVAEAVGTLFPKFVEADAGSAEFQVAPDMYDDNVEDNLAARENDANKGVAPEQVKPKAKLVRQMSYEVPVTRNKSSKKTPAAKTPAAKTPAAKTPAAKTPAAKTLAAKTPKKNKKKE